MLQVAAQELEVPIGSVFILDTDTSKVSPQATSFVYGHPSKKGVSKMDAASRQAPKPQSFAQTDFNIPWIALRELIIH